MVINSMITPLDTKPVQENVPFIQGIIKQAGYKTFTRQLDKTGVIFNYREPSDS